MDEVEEVAENITIMGMSLAEIISRGVFLAIVLVVAYAADRLVRRVVRSVLDASDVPSASIFVNILRAIIWAFALLTVLKPVFGIDPTGIVAALGVTTVAISLGVQDTVSNVIGGLSLMVSRVIQPGDVITISGTTGVVKDINWRSTEITTRAGDVEVIPNSVLNKTTLTKLSEFNGLLVKTPIAIATGWDLDVVTEDVRRLVPEALGDLLVPGSEVTLYFTGVEAYGTQAVVRLSADPSVAVSTIQNGVIRALKGQPWLATALNNSTNDVPKGEE